MEIECNICDEYYETSEWEVIEDIIDGESTQFIVYKCPNCGAWNK